MSKGPSSFEISQHMGKAPSSDTHIERSNVGSSENTTPGDGSKFMSESITGQNDLGAPVKAMNINNVAVPHGSIDELTHVGEEVNLFGIVDQNTSPFGLNKPIPPFTNELTQSGLQHIGVEAQTGAGLQGKTGPINKEGGGHSM